VTQERTEQETRREFDRREFLKLAGLGAGGVIVLVACGTGEPGTATTSAGAATGPTGAGGPATAVPGKEVTLLYVSNLAEYTTSYRQLFDVFEDQYPGIKVELETFNEDTEGAYLARVAGGLLPAMEELPDNSGRRINKDNYLEYVNLSETTFPWFDRWTYDVKNEWADTFGLPGPRSLSPFQGIIVSFVYHKDVMDRYGWDPQNDVKTLDDLETFLDDLEAKVADDPEINLAWDRAWVNGFMYLRYMNLVPVAFPDGTRERQTDCWMGRAKFNAPDSPYRHTFEYTKEALARGWNKDNWWNRSWEGDMESEFIAKKTAMVIHGPWIFDKALAADPSLELRGFPFPSVDGKKTILHMEAPLTDAGTVIRAGNEETDYWAETQEMFNWFFSPETTEARAQIEGRGLVYKLDEPLDLQAPQHQFLVKLLGKPPFENVVLDNGPWGAQRAAPFQISGSPGPWDVGGGSFNDTFIAAIKGDITIQEALDVAQANWDKSYEGLPA